MLLIHNINKFILIFGNSLLVHMAFRLCPGPAGMEDWAKALFCWGFALGVQAGWSDAR